MLAASEPARIRSVTFLAHLPGAVRPAWRSCHPSDEYVPSGHGRCLAGRDAVEDAYVLAGTKGGPQGCGWLACRCAGSPMSRGFMAHCTGSHRYVLDYLAEEVQA